MTIKLILPALTEAVSPFFRPIKYSLFPPLGLATLAGYIDPSHEIILEDEHVESINLSDSPDLVVIQTYITSAYRAYDLADHYRLKGSYVVLGGLHVTSMPEEAKGHADTIFLGPGEDTWPEFLRDFGMGQAKPVYQSKTRSLHNLPSPRRDLIKRNNYLVPNSIVVSRGCPHHCAFCYKDSFFRGGKSFYTQRVDDALSEISRLIGRHLYFLDDHLFASQAFALSLLKGMRGMNRLWQAAGTIQSVLSPGLMAEAAKSGLKSLFLGFETVNKGNLATQNKLHNMNDYTRAIKTLRDLGVMINGSFVFGMDDDQPDVFERTVDWAVENGIETATFHILTPYPGTALYDRMRRDNRLLHSDWDLYDTRHSVFQPANMTASQLESGYWKAYKDFYKWSSIVRSAKMKGTVLGSLRHIAYAGGWKKFDPLWHLLIKLNRHTGMLPLLEKILSGFTSGSNKDIPTRENVMSQDEASPSRLMP